MTRDQIALEIFTALLAKDPLPSQRFTDINRRLETLAKTAFVAADTFNLASLLEDPEKCRAEAQHSWDYNAKLANETDNRSPVNEIAKKFGKVTQG